MCLDHRLQQSLYYLQLGIVMYQTIAASYLHLDEYLIFVIDPQFLFLHMGPNITFLITILENESRSFEIIAEIGLTINDITYQVSLNDYYF